MQQETNTDTTPVKRGKLFRIIKWTAITIGVLIALIFAILIIDVSNDKKPDSEPNQVANESAEAPTPTPEPFNINVTSQIVKKVDGKHRYFFDIRNTDTKDFEGSVTIELITQDGRKLGKETFNTNKPISPNIGTSQYIDINTGPVAVHGDTGITKYTFEVKIDDQVVKSGEANISSEYEAL